MKPYCLDIAGGAEPTKARPTRPTGTRLPSFSSSSPPHPSSPPGASIMYFRRRFSSFEEFQRESFDFGDREFGKEELELIEELQVEDELYLKPSPGRWD